MKKNIIAIIPAFNEERSVGLVVRRVLKQKAVSQCVVIDDGSTDDTAALARQAGAIVLKNIGNLGAGRSGQKGLVFALKNGADAMVIMDADGQHNPEDIPRLTRDAQVWDLIIGSRYIRPTPSTTTPVRQLGTMLISTVLRLLYGVRVYDPTSGYRVISKRAAQSLLGRYPVEFPEPETIILLMQYEYSLHEVAVVMRPRMYGRSSITLWKGCYLLLHFIVNALGYRLTGRKSVTRT
jgi:glycosyltransferase involved in cell wall biosynthesis